MHKVDSLSDDQRIECQREIQSQLMDELATARVLIAHGADVADVADLGCTHQTDISALREACKRELPDSAVATLLYEVCQAYIDCYLKTFKQPKAPAHDPCCHVVAGAGATS